MLRYFSREKEGKKLLDDGKQPIQDYYLDSIGDVLGDKRLQQRSNVAHQICMRAAANGTAACVGNALMNREEHLAAECRHHLMAPQ